MAIQFVTDSACDLQPAEAAALGVTVLPLTVRFGSEEYQDGVELTHRKFYEMLIEREELPTTSQVPPGDFADVFERLTAAGDTVIALTISSKISGTCQSACIAAEDYPGRVFVVDSLSASIGEQTLLRCGLAMAAGGQTAEAIVKALLEMRQRLCVLALLDTLEYLKKGGRISAAAAFTGGLLSIKPVVTMKNGEVVLLGKARGSRQGNNLLMELVEQKGGIAYDLPYRVGYTGLEDSLLQKYIADSKTLWAGAAEQIPCSTIGSTIGTHVGPGAIALAFFANKENAAD